MTLFSIVQESYHPGNSHQDLPPPAPPKVDKPLPSAPEPEPPHPQADLIAHAQTEANLYDVQYPALVDSPPQPDTYLPGKLGCLDNKGEGEDELTAF